MGVLGEISDKMPSAGGLWLFMAVVAVPFVMSARYNHWLAAASLAGAAIFSGLMIYAAYADAFTQPLMSEAIQRELGWVWTASAMLSPLLPTLGVLGVIYFRWRSAKTVRGFEITKFNAPKDLT